MTREGAASSSFKGEVMREVVAIAFVVTFVGFGCARAISSQAKEDLAKPVDRSTAVADIQALEAEKASVAKQVSAGTRSVIPAAAVVGILRRDYGDRAKVASGVYNKQIDEKIEEIRRTCGLTP
jgi:hypothetical protein